MQTVVTGAGAVSKPVRMGEDAYSVTMWGGGALAAASLTLRTQPCSTGSVHVDAFCLPVVITLSSTAQRGQSVSEPCRTHSLQTNRPVCDAPSPTRTSVLHCLSMLALCHLRSTGSAPANFSLGVALPERFAGVAPAGTTFALVSTANLQSALFQVPRDGQASRLPVTTSSTQAWLDSIFTGCQASQVGT